MARSKSKNKNKHRQNQQRKDETGSQKREFALPYCVKESSTVGRYLETLKDLPAGELILKEAPLVIGPSQDSKSLCIGCYKATNFTSDRSYRCKSCHFPLCSEYCSGIGKSYGHSTLECSTLSRLPIKDISPLELTTSLEAITPFRCLILRSEQPEAWGILSGMEAHSTLRKTNKTLWSGNQKNVVDVIIKKWQLKDFDEEIIHHVCGVLEVNAFEVGSGLRAVYPTAYLCAHNCIPNTRHADDSEFKITFWTAVPVSSGSMLTVTYTYILQGTSKRRKHLKETKFFDCQCERCCDSSEMGSNISALKCPVCKYGLVESDQPLITDSTWSCKSSQCSGHKIAGSSVDIITQRMFTELDVIDGNNIPAYEAFLEKYSNTLHGSHYLCLSAMHCLFQLYGKIEGYLIMDLTDKQLGRKIEICEMLLEAFNKLEPGLSKQRGIILYELQAPLMVLLQRQYLGKKVSRIEMKEKLRVISKCLEESHRILEMEPDGSQEALMALAAAEALESLSSWRELMKTM